MIERMSDFDYEMFLLVHGAAKKADALLMEFLTRKAQEAGVDPLTHRFNLETRCFELLPAPPVPVPTGD